MSPHAATDSPLIGVRDRSSTITAAEPRRKAKGETSIRA